MGGVWRNPHALSLMLFPSCERIYTACTPPPATKKAANVCNVFAQGSPLETPYQRRFTWAGHICFRKETLQTNELEWLDPCRKTNHCDPPSQPISIHKTDSNESFNSPWVVLHVSTGGEEGAEDQSSEVTLQCSTSKWLSQSWSPDVTIFLHLCCLSIFEFHLEIHLIIFFITGPTGPSSIWRPVNICPRDNGMASRTPCCLFEHIPDNNRQHMPSGQHASRPPPLQGAGFASLVLTDCSQIMREREKDH